MDFAFLPPEINSFRMYAGPGSSSLLAAAGSWDSLSAELGITAGTYESVLSGLTSMYWQGPAAQSMSATAAPYMGWLQMTAEQTRQTAMQARAAAAAYELAHAMTVHPAAVTANRIHLATLIATNFFGQNTPAIAATELQYAEYWAQDAAAMYGYATSAAAATRFVPFSPPKQTTNESGLKAQNDSVTQAANSAANSGGHGGGVVAAAAKTVPTNPIIPDDFTLLDEILFMYSTTNGLRKAEGTVDGIIGAMNNLNILPDLGAAAAPALAAAPQLTGAGSSLGGGGGLGNISAALANAGRIGSMSVPASWAATPSGSVTALSGSGLPTLPGTGEAVGSGYAGIPGIPGGRVSRATGVIPRYGVRITVMPRPPAAG
jgi:PPE-repeat protein